MGAYGAFLAQPSTTRLLDRMVEDNARVDRELAAREQRERHEAIYLAAIRAWFQRTDKTVACAR